MSIDASSPLVQPARPSGLTRRRLLTSGLGLAGVAGLVVPSTAAYAAVEAANDLVVTNYRPVPAGWPDAHRLTITVVADPTVERGGCVMTAGPTRIDAQIQPALDRVRQILLDERMSPTQTIDVMESS